MGSIRNQQEIKDHCVDNMPTGMGEIYHKLQFELSWLHIKWADYRDLFASGPKRVDLLNATAATFFADVHRMLIESILLHLCRITDSKRSAGHDTLTINSLGQFLPDTGLQAEFQTLVTNACNAAKFARDWRNQQLAHTQLNRALERHTEPLPLLTRQSIEDALEALRSVLNFLGRLYLDGETLYTETSRPRSGVSALVRVLEAGQNQKLPRRKK